MIGKKYYGDDEFKFEMFGTKKRIFVRRRNNEQLSY